MEKKRNFLKLTLRVALLAMGSVILSCSKSSDPITSEISQTVSNESTQDSQQSDVDDIATGQLNTVDAAGRVATASDDRVACAHIQLDSASKSQGTLTIDFDESANGSANASGCTDSRGNVRKGSLVISWADGRWFHVGSVITITFNNYSINGVVINGTRTLTNITTDIAKPSWNIYSVLTSAWPDATTATRTVNRTRQWDIVGATITITQTVGAENAANGTTRYGKSYTVQISNPLVYDIACVLVSKVYIPVSGTEVITVDTSKTITIDFGAGTCDRTFTLTFDGKTDTITGSNDSSGS